MRVFPTAGDGIRFLGRGENLQTGKPANKVRNVWVDGCEFVQNKRTGVSFQRGAEFVWIRGCYIEMAAPSTDSCIDFEPTGFLEGRSIAPTDIIIESNILQHATGAIAVSISGIAGRDPTRRVRFSNNVLLGGGLFCTDVAQLALQDNAIVISEETAGNNIPVLVQRGGDGIVITGNLLVNDRVGGMAVIGLTEVNGRQVSRALVAQNLCYTVGGAGILCLSSDDVSIQGNLVVATGNCTRGIQLAAESSDMDHLAVRDNDISVQGEGKWEVGIKVVSGKHQVHGVSITGNSVRNALEGIVFGGNNFAQTPVVALNRIGPGVTTPLTGLKGLPEDFIVVGGAATTGGELPGTGAGRFLAGLGDPEGRVTGNVGDVFMRLDGSEGAALYVKETDASPVTRWAAK